MSRATVDRRRLAFIEGLIVLLFGGALFFQSRAQLWGADDIRAKADKNKKLGFKDVLKAKRGTIFSSDGKSVAQDEDSQFLHISFRKKLADGRVIRQVPDSRSFFMALAASTGIPASDFEQMDAAGAVFKQWKTPISGAQALEVYRLKRLWRTDGVDLKRTGQREYRLGQTISGLVGMMRDGKAVSGLELSLDKLLSGQDGLVSGMTDRSGTLLPMRHTGENKPAVDGKNITLTIDSTLQIAAVNALRKVYETHRPNFATAIVVDPKTGDILAMANWPSFDPAQKEQPYNPCYTAQLEPGSTFKVLTLAKALSTGAIGTSWGYYCTGQAPIGKRTVKCDLHNGSRAHGQVGIRAAIARSCNVSASIWSRKIGYAGMTKFLEDLGLLKESGLNLPNEVPGYFHYKDPAHVLVTANLGYGQSVTSTPLLLAGAFSVLGNEGVKMPLRLIKRIGNEEQKPGQPVKVVDRESADIVLRCMEGVFSKEERGTGAKLAIPGYRLAGKTGTAQKINAKYAKAGIKRYVSNFVGFVPSKNPKAMILVMVDEPSKGKYYGGEVAGPAWREIALAVIRRYAIQPTEATSPPTKKPSDKTKTVKAGVIKEKNAAIRTVR